MGRSPESSSNRMTTRVDHQRYGQGSVLQRQGDVLLVDFDDGQLRRVLETETSEVSSATADLIAGRWAEPDRVAAKLLAHAIVSTSARWGVFSRSRVRLLPHQLWVAHRVLARWPSRWLVADDVGLGKTIEAGLILSALLGRKRVRRLLILTPASLVEQWQDRLRSMFDLRSAIYTPDVDRPGADYWNTHNVVIASLHTIRHNRRDRWDRLLEAEPWDLVVVDEAHHLHDSERGGPTLALQLLRQMDQHRRIDGLLLFTGTPHRGKDFAFLGLLQLLDPATFDQVMTMEEALPFLHRCVIRNNKALVTDMRGQPLFRRVHVHTHTYAYSPAEQEFYDKLTEFVLSGQAFAASMQTGSQRTAMLVLITLQKLAASSIAAVSSALRNRLKRLKAIAGGQRIDQPDVDRLWTELVQNGHAGGKSDADTDANDDIEAITDRSRDRLVEEIAALMDWLQVSEREVPALEALLALAGCVIQETRLDQMRALLESLPADESVLIFTEYTTTQALILTALEARHGTASVAFINGDGRLIWRAADGDQQTRSSQRDAAATAFREGRVRFLVSTEAGAEGIDLQDRCHTLIHYDLPWNPMRLHQRVGRLNRIGQTHDVDVHLFLNPTTVEGRVWSCLQEKLDRVAATFRGIQAHPEDIHSLVLGAVPNVVTSMNRAAATQSLPDLGAFFEAETSKLGGQEVVTAVRALLGHTARFDFGVDAPSIPTVDLPALQPFLQIALRAAGHRLRSDATGLLSFVVPAGWRNRGYFVRDRYERVHFQRDRQDDAAHRLLGSGVPVVEAALADACTGSDNVATLARLRAPLAVFAVSDGVQTDGLAAPVSVFSVEGRESEVSVLHDWQLVARLNELVTGLNTPQLESATDWSGERRAAWLARASAALEAALPGLELPYQRPVFRLVGVLVPAGG